MAVTLSEADGVSVSDVMRLLLHREYSTRFEREKRKLTKRVSLIGVADIWQHDDGTRHSAEGPPHCFVCSTMKKRKIR